MPKNSFLDSADLPSKPSKRIYGLWLAPKIEVGESGYKVPTIPHAGFDYNRLGKLLGKLFGQFTPAKLLVCNDNIDVSTFDTRILQSQEKGLEANETFEDFGKVVSRNFNKHTDGVIDLRSSPAWYNLKSTGALAGLVYPPQILPICVLTKSEMDSDWWLLQAKGVIKNSPLDSLARSFTGRPAVERPANQGVLPTWALEELCDLYKVWFEPKVMLEPMIPRFY